jgi:hypothetical protein
LPLQQSPQDLQRIVAGASLSLSEPTIAE